MIGYLNYKEVANMIPDYPEPFMNAERVEATLKIDELKIGRHILTGKVVLDVLWNDGGDEGEVFEVVAVVNDSELCIMDLESGDDMPLRFMSILSDKPNSDEIVEALNDNMTTWERYIRVQS